MRIIKSSILAVSILVGMAGSALADTKIGLTMAKFDDKFLTILRNAVADQAKSVDGVSVDIVDAKNDVGTQLEQVKAFIAQKVDAILLCPVDEGQTKEMADLAGAAGIPLVYINKRPPEDKFVGKVAIVSSNDLVAGRLQMLKLAGLMGGKGNLVILNGDPKASAALERTRGMKEILARFPDIKIVQEGTANWSRDEGEATVSGWLKSGAKIDAVAADNDEMAIGAIQAFQKANVSLDSVVIGGVDATPDALAQMQQGNMEVTVLQNAARQGQQAITDAIKMAKGERAQLYDWVPYELVTTNNLSEYHSN